MPEQFDRSVPCSRALDALRRWRRVVGMLAVLALLLASMGGHAGMHAPSSDAAHPHAATDAPCGDGPSHTDHDPGLCTASGFCSGCLTGPRALSLTGDGNARQAVDTGIHLDRSGLSPLLRPPRTLQPV